MEDFLEKLINFLLPHNNIYLYIFLFISAIVENIFPPIPGDTITAFGAFLVGTGRLNYLLVYISTTLGSVAGFMFLFLLAKQLGKKYFIEKDYKLFSADSIISAEKWFQKFGYYIVLLNRFFPGIRSVISIVSGISKLNTFRVLLLSLLSASVWNLIWIHTGYILGNNWEIVKKRMGEIIRNYNIAVGITLVAIVIGYIVIKKIKAKKQVNQTK